MKTKGLIITCSLFCVCAIVVGLLSVHADRKRRSSQSRVFETLKPAVEKYFAEHSQTFLETTFWKPAFGGKIFCAYNLLGGRMRGKIAELYIDRFCGEYTSREGRGAVLESAGGNAELIFIDTRMPMKIIGYTDPDDGTWHAASLYSMFPGYALRMLEVNTGGPGYLQQTAERNATNYFKSFRTDAKR